MRGVSGKPKTLRSILSAKKRCQTVSTLRVGTLFAEERYRKF